MGAAAVAMLSGVQVTSASAEDTLNVPSLSYRTGPFAGGGIQHTGQGVSLSINQDGAGST